MDIQNFLVLLSGYSVLTSLIVEAIKNIIGENTKVSYNIIVLVVAVIVGVVGSMMYFYFGNVTIGADQVIYSVFMGLASCLCATVGYDKVKQTIEQLL